MQILNNEGGTYAANIVQDASGGPAMAEDFKPIYDAFAQRVAWIDGEVCPGAFQMNTAWYYAVPEKDPVFEEHAHDSDELIGFIGSDPEDPYNLNAEIVVSINGEDHLLTKSSIIFVPAGLPHARISIKRVDRPVFHFSVVTSRSYDNGAYGK